MVRSAVQLAGAVLAVFLMMHPLGMADQTAPATLAPGDRVVFLGDSITQAGDQPGGYVQLIREAVAHEDPAQSITVLGAGISGNKVPDLEARLERDVLAKNPTLVVIYIGINDVWHSQRGRGTDKPQYEQGLRNLIAKITETGSRVVLATPSVIGEKTDGSNPLDEMLDEYADISRRVARETNTPLVDLRRAFLEHLKQHNPDNQERGVLTGDGVHLNAEGNAFVARTLLAALGQGESASREGQVLRHIVLFQFKDDVSDEQVTEVVEAFKKLPEKIDAIIGFEHGTQVNIEPLNDGLTHGFVVTFRDREGLAEYLPHPAHKEFVSLVKPRLEKVLVFDYYTEAQP